MTTLTQAQQQVLAWLDDHREDVIAFLQEMIRIPSVNPWFHDTPGPSHEDRVQDVIAARMRALGAAIERWEPNADELAEYAGRAGYYPGRDFTGRPNQAAIVKGSGGGKSMLLTGHIDVVKAGNGWSYPPFEGVRANGNIYGRGTVDMKGGIAAMIMALEAVMRSGFKLKGDVIVGTVVDEEAGGMGTLAFAAKGYRADGCILTESTQMKIAPLCRGILWGKLTIPGRSGHIELPQGDWRDGGAKDAIALARLYMDHFDHLNNEWRRIKTHPLLPMPCQIYVAQLNAGEYPTAFANSAEIVFNAQYLPREKDDMGLGGKVKRDLETFFNAIAQTDPWLIENPPKLEWLIDADCGETAADHPFVQVCANSLEAIGYPPALEGVSAHTDMGWFVNVGIPTVNFGPGNMRVAHQNDEHVPEHELIDSARMIALALMDWCEVEGA
jgi:acetylornithine deacetylase